MLDFDAPNSSENDEKGRKTGDYSSAEWWIYIDHIWDQNWGLIIYKDAWNKSDLVSFHVIDLVIKVKEWSSQDPKVGVFTSVNVNEAHVLRFTVFQEQVGWQAIYELINLKLDIGGVCNYAIREEYTAADWQALHSWGRTVSQVRAKSVDDTLKVLLWNSDSVASGVEENSSHLWPELICRTLLELPVIIKCSDWNFVYAELPMKTARYAVSD